MIIYYCYPGESNSRKFLVIFVIVCLFSKTEEELNKTPKSTKTTSFPAISRFVHVL